MSLNRFARSYAALLVCAPLLAVACGSDDDNTGSGGTGGTGGAAGGAAGTGGNGGTGNIANSGGSGNTGNTSGNGGTGNTGNTGGDGGTGAMGGSAGTGGATGGTGGAAGGAGGTTGGTGGTTAGTGGTTGGTGGSTAGTGGTGGSTAGTGGTTGGTGGTTGGTGGTTGGTGGTTGGTGGTTGGTGGTGGSSSGTTLAPGEIAIVGVQTDTPDSFTFVTFVDLAPGTQINFTDDGWLDVPASGGNPAVLDFRRNGGNFSEDAITIQFDAQVSAGSVFLVDGLTVTPSANVTVSVPSYSNGTSGLTGLSASGDQVLAYQGTDTNPSFLFGVSCAKLGFDGTDSSTTSYIPAALNPSGGPAYFINVSNDDDCDYTGLRSGSAFSAYNALITDTANWTTSNTAFTNGLTTTNFTN